MTQETTCETCGRDAGPFPGWHDCRDPDAVDASVVTRFARGRRAGSNATAYHFAQCKRCDWTGTVHSFYADALSDATRHDESVHGAAMPAACSVEGRTLHDHQGGQR